MYMYDVLFLQFRLIWVTFISDEEHRKTLKDLEVARRNLQVMIEINFLKNKIISRYKSCSFQIWV